MESFEKWAVKNAPSVIIDDYIPGVRKETWDRILNLKIRLRLSSFGDLMRHNRELDDDNRDRFRRSSKHRPIDFKLWFVAPRSRHHTSRQGDSVSDFPLDLNGLVYPRFWRDLKCFPHVPELPLEDLHYHIRWIPVQANHLSTFNICMKWGKSSTCHIE